jgi:hypothetical protein
MFLCKRFEMIGFFLLREVSLCDKLVFEVKQRICEENTGSESRSGQLF